MKGILTVIAIVLVGILTIVTGVGCANNQESEVMSEEKYKSITWLEVNIYEQANWGGCDDGRVVLNGKIYPTHDLRTNIHLYGSVMSKRVVCDVVDGQEGMWIDSAGISKFYTNSGTFIR